MANLFNKISFINLYSSDNEKLLRFYRDIVGLKPQEGQSEEDNWYGFETEGVTFAIEPESNRDKIDFDYNRQMKILIQFKAENLMELENMNRQLEDNGVELLRRSFKTSYGTITNFIDPDGNLVEVLCENND